MSTASEQIFVGGNAELRVMRERLAAARESHPGIIFVEGGAGIGKSALVRRFLRDAGPGATVRISGEEAESAIAYGLVSQIVGQVPAGQARELSTMVSDAGADPVAVGGALLRLLDAAQGRAGLLLVVEDLHWGDVPSGQALLFALRRLRVDRVLALVTYRPAGLSRLGEGWRRLLTDDERSRHIGLTGLRVDDILALAGLLGISELTRAGARRIHEHSAGNALYIRALLEELPPVVLGQPAGPVPAPRSIAATILARLAALSPHAQRLVQAAAVLGGHPPVYTAALLAGVADSPTALEEAGQAGLLAEIPADPDRLLTFPHELIRSAVYEDLRPVRRGALHSRAAELLGGEAALTHRVLAAPGFDAVLADEVEAAAKAKEARSALLEAAAWWRRASALSPDRRSRERRLLTAVDRLLNGGDAAGAEALRAAVERCSDGPLRNYVLGYMAFVGGRAQDAERLLTAAADAPPRPGEDPGTALTRASATTQLCRLLVVAGRSTEALSRSLRVLPLLPPSSVQRSRHAAILVVAQFELGPRAQALALVEHLPALHAAPTSADERVARGMVRLWMDDLTGAMADLSDVVEAGRASLRADNSAQAMGFLGEAEYRAGLWDQAIARTELLVSLSHDAGRIWDFAFVHGIAALPRAGRGDWTEAEAHVRAALAAAAEFGLAAAVGWAAHAQAALAAARGDQHGVLDATRALAGLRGGGTVDPGILPWRPLRTEALVELRQLDEAEQELDTLEAVLADRDVPAIGLDLARVRATLAAARGDVAAADAAFTAGAQILPAVPRPLNRGLFHLARGHFLRGSGQRQAAVRELRAAHAIFVGLDARPYAERSEQELIACRLRPGEARRRDPLGLTGQELAVARLVAEGRRNREVASELYVTTKTVEYHLANVYAKLGVTNRVELAARFHQLAREPEGG
ncbi:MAG: hypothetical protein V7603_4953 [Micromonosporaceae bacterium]